MYIDCLVVSGCVNKNVNNVYVLMQNMNIRVIISFIINLYARYKLLFNRIHFNLFRKFDDGLF